MTSASSIASRGVFVSTVASLGVGSPARAPDIHFDGRRPASGVGDPSPAS